MIEVKNLRKTYQPKKGPAVLALDDVSLKFGETGMVFILGKSGSGKSTLLNILGGLDRYDSGEFIIDGKSSNEFSQADLDSYRNTLIGFIFQEYNILDEFTVGANIALAMQLQGKKSTAEALNKILNDVDLVDFGNRKPNELSGGQKQRVAIARALIKDPRIIMADEPTGALDSNTGRQVFDTLKKLSKDKLVIIVSHDREFAEYYGDRVIELADGKIISDISKYEAKPDSVSDGISIVDGRIMQIRKGYKLNNKDIAMINEYLANAETDALLTVDERSNRSFKQIAMISDDGGKQSFADTDNNAIVAVENKPLKLIKSRLPYKHSLKIGASSLKSKPIKLIFTILLSFIAFALFGVADTLGSYNEKTAAFTSINDFKIQNATFSKQYLDKEGYYGYEGVVTDAELADIKKNTGLDVRPIYGNIGQYSFYQNLLNQSKLPNSYYSYYQTNFTGYVVIDQKLLDDTGYNLIGRLPNNDKEIVIPKHIYESFTITGYNLSTPSVSIPAEDISSPQKFVDAALLLNINDKQSATVVGIIDTNFDPNGRYDSFKTNDTNQNGIMDYTMQAEMQSEINFGYHGLMFVNQKFLNSTDNNIGKYFSNNEYCSLNFSSGTDMNISRALTFAQAAGIGIDVKRFNNSANNNGIALSTETVSNNYRYMRNYISVELERINLSTTDASVSRMYYNPGTGLELNTANFTSTQYFDSLFNSNDITLICEALIDWDLLSYPGVKEDTIKRWNELFSGSEMITDQTVTDSNACYILTYLLERNHQLPDYAVDIIKEIRVDLIYNAIQDYNLLELMFGNANINYNNYSSNYGKEKHISANIVGIFYDESSNQMIMDETLYNSFEFNDKGYRACIAPMPTDRNQIKKIVDYSYTIHDSDNANSNFVGYCFMLQNANSASLNSVGSMIKTFSKVFLYIGIGFAVFASLLLMNFISTSISYKKREIGILRAVGARGSDVFGIFFNESMIIALINFALATIATVVCCFALNNVFSTELGISITLLSFGIRQVALLFFVAVAAAFIASLLPVMKISRKRPIDAIRNR